MAAKDATPKPVPARQPAKLKTPAKSKPAPRSSVDRSRARKLVAKLGKQEVIVRMSPRQQAACIAATGSLPKIGDVEFKRADGTPTSKIAAMATEDE
jgi:hypothetical protein